MPPRGVPPRQGGAYWQGQLNIFSPIASHSGIGGNDPGQASALYICHCAPVNFFDAPHHGLVPRQVGGQLPQQGKARPAREVKAVVARGQGALGGVYTDAGRLLPLGDVGAAVAQGVYADVLNRRLGGNHDFAGEVGGDSCGAQGGGAGQGRSGGSGNPRYGS